MEFMSTETMAHNGNTRSNILMEGGDIFVIGIVANKCLIFLREFENMSYTLRKKVLQSTFFGASGCHK